jgi:CheY-like chemotaxis protein
VNPDLLLVDFAMPGMNAAQMAERVRLGYSGLPIVFASGYSETAAIQRIIGKADTLLKKPFSVADLEAALNAALGG